jgi:putative DNA primase/helicase
MPKSIEPFQLALCIMKTHHAINLSYVDDSTDGDIAVYCDEGLQEGLYTTDVDCINNIIYTYHAGIQKNAVDEVMSRLKAWAPRKARNSNRDFIPVNNGIYDYKNKKLLPFSPDYVFLTKSRTNYNPNATNVVITNNEDGTTWDVESWMEELTDDPAITNLLWEITGALLRPNVAWNKSAWLYSDKGENGKGTLCAMWRNLCGSAATSIPISDFAKDFMLSSLTTSQAIIVDENDVGTFIDKAGALKAVITNDVVYINRKFKDPVRYQFHGFMVQCLNELPRFRDKSDSIYRRQLFIPMNKCFTGKARTYIKSDYINRPEVLEYVMKRVFDMDYYALSEPDACRIILDEYKIYNDPVRQFWAEFEEQFVWDILQYSFLYSLFKEWFKRDNPSGSIMGRNTFIKDLQNAVSGSTVFQVPVGNDKIRTTGRMDMTETLIATYNLVEWQTPGLSSKSSTIEAMCRPIIADAYRGLIRVANVAANNDDDDDNDNNNNVSSDGNAVVKADFADTTAQNNNTTLNGQNVNAVASGKVLSMPPQTVTNVLSHTPAPASHVETEGVSANETLQTSKASNGGISDANVRPV